MICLFMMIYYMKRGEGGKKRLLILLDIGTSEALEDKKLD